MRFFITILIFMLIQLPILHAADSTLRNEIILKREPISSYARLAKTFPAVKKALVQEKKFHQENPGSVALEIASGQFVDQYSKRKFTVFLFSGSAFCGASNCELYVFETFKKKPPQEVLSVSAGIFFYTMSCPENISIIFSGHLYGHWTLVGDRFLHQGNYKSLNEISCQP